MLHRSNLTLAYLDEEVLKATNFQRRYILFGDWQWCAVRVRNVCTITRSKLVSLQGRFEVYLQINAYLPCQ